MNSASIENTPSRTFDKGMFKGYLRHTANTAQQQINFTYKKILKIPIIFTPIFPLVNGFFTRCPGSINPLRSIAGLPYSVILYRNTCPVPYPQYFTNRPIYSRPPRAPQSTTPHPQQSTCKRTHTFPHTQHPTHKSPPTKPHLTTPHPQHPTHNTPHTTPHTQYTTHNTPLTSNNT